MTSTQVKMMPNLCLPFCLQVFLRPFHPDQRNKKKLTSAIIDAKGTEKTLLREAAILRASKRTTLPPFPAPSILYLLSTLETLKLLRFETVCRLIRSLSVCLVRLYRPVRLAPHSFRPVREGELASFAILLADLHSERASVHDVTQHCCSFNHSALLFHCRAPFLCCFSVSLFLHTLHDALLF